MPDAPPVNKNTGVGNQQLRGDSSNILGVIKVQGGPDFAANVMPHYLNYRKVSIYC